MDGSRFLDCEGRLDALVSVGGDLVSPVLLERFRAKWIPVRVKKTRQNKNLEPRSDSIGTGKALVAAADPADRTVVALDRNGAASAISAIVSVGAISGSIVVSVVARLGAHPHAAERSIDGNLS
ncbi:hypothetical protein BEL01nite_67300 [Bradyrhizobium elkanii]|nr:hypothetical protein BEL01nite_67300 [Bradyrhizobium elkanii]